MSETDEDDVSKKGIELKLHLPESLCTDKDDENNSHKDHGTLGHQKTTLANTHTISHQCG